ncbi:hypothetical protein [Undibacterium macrobrachii]|jgi:hypothetical protein|uniref:hypothetical protein n=1 Tax=Undibacterium macrobrachii TaxID=1119058 RepID=UPI00167C1CB1|nr:hypothetical protein [Undibacterium macrobrachii]
MSTSNQHAKKYVKSTFDRRVIAEPKLLLIVSSFDDEDVTRTTIGDRVVLLHA